MLLPQPMLLRPAVLVVGLFVVVRGQVPAPDLILYNGTVITVDAAFRTAEGVAITHDTIAAVGKNDVIRAMASAATKQIDLNGRTVVPGLMDNHLHNVGGGAGVDLSGARSLGEVLTAVAGRVRDTPGGGIVISNSDWHEAQLREHRLPLRDDFDQVAPTSPVILVRGGHEYIVNSAAFRHWKITAETPQPDGGRISRYADGRLDGELVDRAKDAADAARANARRADRRSRRRIQQASGSWSHNRPTPRYLGRRISASAGDATPWCAEDAWCTRCCVSAASATWKS